MMAKQDIIVIGASAGGLVPLMDLVRELPVDFPGSIFVVVHVPAFSKSELPKMLTRLGKLKAVHAKDGDPIEKSMIYVAPPDHHMLIEEGGIIVKKGPKENRFRPSIDALFRSAAYEYGTRVVGVILSGMLDDGTSGLWTVKRLGGTAIVQDLEEATYDSMPRSALEYVEIDHVLNVLEMPAILQKLSKKSASRQLKIPVRLMKLLETEIVIAAKDNAFQMGILEMGDLTPFTCPECHGVLVQLKEAGIMRFRCHTGHAFTASALLAGVSETSEEALWQAMRALEESTMLLSKMAEHFKSVKQLQAAEVFFKKADTIASRAKVIHNLVSDQEQISGELKNTISPSKELLKKPDKKTRVLKAS
jgi:two-component system chemotaxis response regulator CheB